MESETNDCCQDEEVVLISSTDFIISSSKSILDNLSISGISFFYHNFNAFYLFSERSAKSLALLSVPIALQKQKVLATIILRV